VTTLDLSVDRRADLPLGAQLTRKLREHVRSGRLAAGDRLPSLREAAATAGVNLNTVRAVYARLEHEGLVQTEHGRGTFVASGAGDAPSRRELLSEIERLEAELVRYPPPALPETAAPAGATLLSTADLERIRDDLMARLRDLDAQRAALLRTLEDLGVDSTAAASDRHAAAPSRRDSPSLAGARIRWVGA
jgi:DNA-binding transcriptional regulator YhcF (GntR family)